MALLTTFTLPLRFLACGTLLLLATLQGAAAIADTATPATTAEAPAAQQAASQVEEWGWGPFYWEIPADENALNMTREFAAGPFWEQRWSPTRHDWFLRPLWANYHHLDVYRHDGHLLPPLFTLRETDQSFDWNVLLFTRYRRIGPADEASQHTFYIFPFFFYNSDPVVPEHSFWGLLPVYGELQYFFMYRSMFWVLFPLYLRNELWDGVVRTGTPWPFVQSFSGPDNTRGLYLWPLWGNAKRDNHFDNQFVFWPLIYRYVDKLDKPIPRVRQGFLPFYAFEYGEKVEDVSILMFWGWRHDYARKYDETRYLWPLWVQGRGERSYVNRWAPFYTHSIQPTLEKWWWMWPLVQHRKSPDGDILMERSQFFYFLYWYETQTSISNPELPKAEMTFIWPFYADYDNGAGLKQTQVLSLFEVFFPHNRAVRDTYSPLFALFRSEQDEKHGASRWSLLWNLVGQNSVSNEQKQTDDFHIWPFYQSRSKTTAQEHSSAFSILYGLIGWSEQTPAPTGGNTLPAAEDSDTALSPATTDEPGHPEPQSRSTLTLLWFDIEL